MKKLLIVLCLFQLMELYAQTVYEPGVILLQVCEPNAVKFNAGHVVKGSNELQRIFLQYPAINSRKLSHVDIETDGCYRIEYPLSFSWTTIMNESSLKTTNYANFTKLRRLKFNKIN